MTTVPTELVRALRQTSAVAVLTGSGVSAESGIPTFRGGGDSLWKRYDPRELATPEAFSRDPRLVWEWYLWRRSLVVGAEPNPAHLALAEMEGFFSSFTLITQNVDGLHERAGSRNVLELHGNILRSRCTAEGEISEPRRQEVPPRCRRCGDLLRPDVVWFGEMLPEGPVRAAFEASSSCGVFFSVGTSSLVYPAAALPEEARASGAILVEINPEETPLTRRADFSFRESASVVLPELVKRLRAQGDY
ncbi:SIR2 family NAD-dependent protein deacylase [Rubrobacter naiadicus]|uniref:SIR2 family NAD-dependent protein deacylase n=1 Tax=Rubrobacter naiadicus TaxID=1392641 RepID=UPI002362A665|nr:NAD-dependent deacylase [Rubrobacter naiadicus]